MKVYDLPDAVPAPVVDYRAYNHAVEQQREQEHMAQLEAWLRLNGFNGPNTGGIYRVGVADGYAEYMLAEGKRSILIHLPYGDAYQSRDVEFLPKKEILARIDKGKRLVALFAKT